MKLDSIIILTMLPMLLLAGCRKDRVSVRLYTEAKEGSLMVITEVENKTGNDIFIPAFEEFLEISDDDDINVADAYFYAQFAYEIEHFLEPSAANDINKEYWEQDAQFFKIAGEMEMDNFININSEEILSVIKEKGYNDLRAFAKFYSDKKYDGVTVKAEQTRKIATALDCLYDSGEPKSDFEIRFKRRSPLYYYPLALDAMGRGNILFYTPFPDSVGSYHIYQGKIKCNDVIKIKKRD